MTPSSERKVWIVSFTGHLAIVRCCRPRFDPPAGRNSSARCQLSPRLPVHGGAGLSKHLDAHMVGAGGAMGLDALGDGVDVAPGDQPVDEPVAAVADVVLGEPE